ncbi:MAG: type 2 isopentenyl-diphosphate Delta-isomerase [Planctomycetota bacterium]
MKNNTSKSNTSGRTSSRKSDHIRICLDEAVEFNKTNGFERYEFDHNALPEIDWDEIDTSTTFMGKRFSAPILIEAMTGGTSEARKINHNLARAAGELGIGMGVGSQRAAVENQEMASTYQIRHVAPKIFILANLGAAQIIKYSAEQIRSAVSMIDADALVIHLNTAQEIFQRQGHREWKNVLAGINRACSLGFPVIVKEVGCGISADVARKLEDAGVSAIDVAGAGGTSWVKVEQYNHNSKTAGNFCEWGIPTADSLAQCVKTVKIPLISSGGIRTGLDIAKSIAMGASLAGIALPLLKPATESHEAVKERLEEMITELKATMLLVGARSIEELKRIEVREA